MDPDAKEDAQALAHGSTSQKSGGAATGIANHKRKMATQKKQVNSGQGATTGGFATSPGNVVVPPAQGKFLSKGKY